VFARTDLLHNSAFLATEYKIHMCINCARCHYIIKSLTASLWRWNKFMHWPRVKAPNLSYSDVNAFFDCGKVTWRDKLYILRPAVSMSKLFGVSVDYFLCKSTYTLIDRKLFICSKYICVELARHETRFFYMIFRVTQVTIKFKILTPPK